MFRKFVLSSITGVALLAASLAGAATKSYDSRTPFQNALSTSVTDDYQNSGYVFSQTDAAMSSVLGETDYQSTGFSNLNLVVGTVNKRYCAGCNGSFLLGFGSTSVGNGTGVFGVGFDYTNSATSLYSAFVTFGDGTMQNFALAPADLTGFGFFAITSELLISSIALGLPGGAATTNGSFSIDNLTVGAEAVDAVVPLPPGLPLLLGALVMLGALRRPHLTH